MSNLLDDEPIQTYITLSKTGDLTGYWIDALGLIACYFAQMEGLSHAIVDLLGNAGDQKRLTKMPYQDRTEYARALVFNCLNQRSDTKLAVEWDALMKEAISFAQMRNDILHNPLSINIASGTGIEDPQQGIILLRKEGRPRVKLGKVQAFANTMRDFNRRMLDLMQRSHL